MRMGDTSSYYNVFLDINENENFLTLPSIPHLSLSLSLLLSLPPISIKCIVLYLRVKVHDGFHMLNNVIVLSF